MSTNKGSSTNVMMAASNEQTLVLNNQRLTFGKIKIVLGWKVLTVGQMQIYNSHSGQWPMTMTVPTWACRCACALVVLKFHLCLDSSSENVLKLPDHRTVRKPEEWIVYYRISHNCLWVYSHFPEQRSQWQTGWGQQCRSLPKKDSSFIYLYSIHRLLLTGDDSYWNKSPSNHRKPDPHSDPQSLCEVA